MPKLIKNLFKRVKFGTVSKALEVSKSITPALIPYVTPYELCDRYIIG